MIEYKTLKNTGDLDNRLIKKIYDFYHADLIKLHPDKYKNNERELIRFKLKILENLSSENIYILMFKSKKLIGYGHGFYSSKNIFWLSNIYISKNKQNNNEGLKLIIRFLSYLRSSNKNINFTCYAANPKINSIFKRIIGLKEINLKDKNLVKTTRKINTKKYDLTGKNLDSRKPILRFRKK